MDRLKQTLIIDIERYKTLPSREIVDRLYEIPEVLLAFSMYERRNQKLPFEPQTKEECAEIVQAIERVADWLSDGFHDQLVADLREIAGDIGG
jgi:HEPN domain-containing protein